MPQNHSCSFVFCSKDSKRCTQSVAKQIQGSSADRVLPACVDLNENLLDGSVAPHVCHMSAKFCRTQRLGRERNGSRLASSRKRKRTCSRAQVFISCMARWVPSDFSTTPCVRYVGKARRASSTLSCSELPEPVEQSCSKECHYGWLPRRVHQWLLILKSESMHTRCQQVCGGHSKCQERSCQRLALRIVADNYYYHDQHSYCYYYKHWLLHRVCRNFTTSTSTKTTTCLLLLAKARTHGLTHRLVLAHAHALTRTHRFES